MFPAFAFCGSVSAVARSASTCAVGRASAQAYSSGFLEASAIHAEASGPLAARRMSSGPAAPVCAQCLRCQNVCACAYGSAT
eukprot:8087668-Alexandrium_andersonii.AAC.1